MNIALHYMGKKVILILEEDKNSLLDVGLVLQFNGYNTIIYNIKNKSVEIFEKPETLNRIADLVISDFIDPKLNTGIFYNKKNIYSDIPKIFMVKDNFGISKDRIPKKSLILDKSIEPGVLLSSVKEMLRDN